MCDVPRDASWARRLRRWQAQTERRGQKRRRRQEQRHDWRNSLHNTTLHHTPHYTTPTPTTDATVLNTVIGWVAVLSKCVLRSSHHAHARCTWPSCNKRKSCFPRNFNCHFSTQTVFFVEKIQINDLFCSCSTITRIMRFGRVSVCLTRTVF